MNTIVLLISNDEAYLARTANLLSGTGAVVESCKTLAGAVERLATGNAGLIVLDDHIAEADVWECCAILRSKISIPILITGPDPDSRAVIRAISQGADFYLKRPFSNGEFLARIGALLRRHRMSQ